MKPFAVSIASSVLNATNTYLLLIHTVTWRY